MSARDVIADIICDWEIRNGFEVGHGKSTNDHADEVITRLRAQGFEVKTALDLMIDHDMAFLKGLRAGAKFGVLDGMAFDAACASLVREIKAAKSEREAVPGGDVCHLPEQHMHETTSNDAQKS